MKSELIDPHEFVEKTLQLRKGFLQVAREVLADCDEVTQELIIGRIYTFTSIDDALKETSDLKINKEVIH